MLRCAVACRYRVLSHSPAPKWKLSAYLFSTKTNDFTVAKTRNIGIIAHIDAGKTTTTERMLHYAGVTRKIGDVDDGDTVMDYLQAERDRGITINSAAITFGWRGHRINLIDTPGHVDFTIEVERAVRVLDGAVTILDGVAGVEAQTQTVWHQADRYNVPRIAFVNKMDRVGAAFGRTVREIRSKLGARPLVVQIPGPMEESSNGMTSVADIVTMELLEWDDATNGATIKRTPLEEGPTFEEAVRGRTALVESLAELDDTIVELFFDQAEGDHMQVKADDIKQAIRRVTLQGKAVPVLCGAAFKNIGVQPVMDAVIDYLPSPLDRPSAIAHLNNGTKTDIALQENGKLVALAFKVTHDPRRGALVYVRVYSGKLNDRSTIFNTTTNSKERVNRLLQMYAKDVEEIPHITAGNIGVIVGLRDTRTGDTLVQSNDSASIKSKLQLGRIDIPSPVFFMAIEPVSVSEEKPIEEALKKLLREDPSLHVWTDSESGQTLISGMGELHLEIVKDRLLNDFKCKADMGKMRISYRETCQSEAVVNHIYDKELLGKRVRAACRIALRPMSDDTDEAEALEAGWEKEGGSLLQVDVGDMKEYRDGDEAASSGSSAISQEEAQQAVKDGLMSGLSRGALLSFPLTRLQIRADKVQLFGADTTPGAIAACVSHAVFDAVKQASPALLEPMMEVHIEVAEDQIGSVVGDLSGTRRGHVIGLESSSPESQFVQQEVNSLIYAPPDSAMAGGTHHQEHAMQKRVIKAHVPLSSMVGYSSALRSLTAGNGTFSMRVIGYGDMSQDRERTVIKEIKGY
ncbi:Ribosome-releasing factor 2, mitochondrial [Umbelopsis sp. WA50703]